MSVQILLQGKISHAREFLAAGEPSESELAGRCHWVGLLAEILPRALIAELNLSKMLLGSSGGEQFLVVLPSEVRAQAEEFLANARAAAHQMSQGHLSLLWAITENLGDWTVVRKRLNEEMQRKSGTPLAGMGPGASAPPAADDAVYFADLGVRLRDVSSIGWSPDAPARLTPGEGKYTWAIGSGPGAAADAIPLTRHTALREDGHDAASTSELAARAEGRSGWGVLRGDVDNFGIRIRRAQTIEEHVQLSVLYQQFFAGELEVLCSLGEFWRKVTLLYAGGDDFAVYGAWDALIMFARELQRLFQRFSEEHLKDFPGPEGKTITMALALAPDGEARLGAVHERAWQRLELAKSTDKDCFLLFGRTLEWKQLSDAAELKDDLTRLVREFGAPPNALRDLCSIYRETRRNGAGGERTSRRTERPWRFHRRLNRILGSSRSRDFQKARASLIAELVGKNPAHLKLRPSSRVALEWARLSTEGKNE
jgi:CRISPR-associated protein Csm1